MSLPRNQPATRLLTPAEAAAVLRVKPGTVTRWARTGRIPGVRTPGGRYRILASAIDAIIRPDDETGLPGDATTEQALVSPPAA